MSPTPSDSHSSVRRTSRLLAAALAGVVLAGGLSTPVAIAVEPAPTEPTLTGVVTAATGGPVTGSLVLAYPSGGGAGTTDTTDGAGAYSLALAPGSWTLMVHSPDPNPDDLAGVDAEVVIPTSGAVIRDVVLPVGNFTGTVNGPTDSGVAPVAGAQLSLFGTTSSAYRSARTGSDGTFAIAVSAGTYTLGVDPPYQNPQGYVPTYRSSFPIAADGTTTMITLDRGNVRGRVLGTDGQPVVGASVSGYDVDGAGSQRATSGQDGAYALLLPAGTWRLQAEPPFGSPSEVGAGTRESVVVPSDGGELVGQDIQLTVTNVRGSVVRPDGSVVPDAYVVASAAGQPDVASWTGDTGGYGLRLTPGATYTLRATPPHGSDEVLQPGTRVVTAPPGVDDVLAGQDIALQLPNLTGRVLPPVGDTGVAAAGVWLRDGAGEFLDHQIARTDGTFGFAVAAGTYRVTAEPPSDDATGLLAATVEIAVAADAPAVADVRLKQGSVYGHVYLPGGAEPAGNADLTVYDLEARTRLGGSTSATASGAYALDLPPGRYRITAHPAYGSDAVKTSIELTVADAPLGGRDLVLGTPRSRPFSAEQLDVADDETVEPDGSAEQVSLSDDGGVAAFVSYATNLVTGQTVEGSHAYVRDRTAGTTTLVDTALTFENGGGDVLHVSLSGDGRYVAYDSTRTDLDVAGSYGDVDVYLLDRVTGTTRLVSAGPEGQAVGGRQPVVSDDGRFVAYRTYAPELTGAETFVDAVVVTDLSTGQTRVVATGSIVDYDLSGDGTTVAWYATDDPADPIAEPTTRTYHRVGDAEPTVVGAAYTGPVYGVGRPSLSRDGSILLSSTLTLTAEQQTRHALLRYDARTGVSTPQEPFSYGSMPGTGPTFPVLSEDGAAYAFAGAAPDAREAWYSSAWVRQADADPLPAADESADARTMDLSADGSAVAVLSHENLASPGSGGNGFTHAYLALPAVDETAPAWTEPVGALTAPVVGSSLVQLQWTPAEDDVAVTGYRVLRDGSSTPLATLPGTARTFTVDGLLPSTGYTFRVAAGDAAGNWSTENPSVQVTTAAVATGGSALLTATATGSGSAALSWETDPTATSYRVLRRTATSALAPVATTTSTSLADIGLDAETTYTWVVESVDGNGPRPHTGQASATTAALAVPTFEASLPTLVSGALPLGGSVGFTVRGEPGRTVTVDVARSTTTDGEMRLSAPQSLTSTVALVEDGSAPGTYRGAWAVDEGTVELTALTARLADGGGHSVTRTPPTPLPLPVTGRLSVTLDETGEVLRGARLETWSQSDFTTRSTPLATSGPTTVALTAGVYGARVYSAAGELLAQAADLSVSTGRTVHAALALKLPATVTVSVRLPDQTPLAGMSVTLSDSSGTYVGNGTTGENGQVVIRGARTGSSVVASVRLPWDSPLTEPAPVGPVLLEAASTSISIVVTPPVRGTVTGVVRGSDGEPVGGATVTATSGGDRPRSVSARSGSDGRYTLQVPVGSAKLSASHNGEGAAATVSVTENATTTQDLALTAPTTYRVDLRLRVQNVGETTPSAPLALDWRTAVHFSVDLSAGRTHLSAYGFPTDATNVVDVDADAGDTVKLCANGREADLPDVVQCATTVLGADMTPSVELVLLGGSRLTGGVAYDNGDVVSGYMVNVDRITATGRELVATQNGYGPDWTVGVPGAGSYLVEVSDGSRSAGITVDVAGNSVVDVPTLVLRQQTHFGGADNAITAVRPEVLPGTLADLRATYRNTGAAVAGAVLRVQVPAGSQAPAAGFLLNGSPVGTTPGTGVVDVPLGDLPTGASGTVRYSLRMPADATTALRAAAGIHAEGLPEQPLYSVDVRLAGLSLDVPSDVTSRTLPLSGRALPGAAVEVRDGTALLGATTASDPGGLWRLPVTLPDRGLLSDHQLVASSGEQRVERRVSYDGSRPTLIGMSLSQIDEGRADGREYSFDPRLGVARFPFVFVPGQPTVVRATFDRPQDVTSVTAHIGEVSATAVRCGTSPTPVGCAGQPAGVFAAAMDIDGRGDLSVEYESTSPPLPVDGPPITVQEARNRVPLAWAGFSPSPQPGDGEYPETGSATASFSVPVPGEAEPAVLQLTESVTTNVHYAPTAADLANEAASGSPVMGVTVSQADDGALTLTGYIPVDRIPADSPLLGSQAPATTMSGLRMAARDSWGRPVRASGFGDFGRALISPVKAVGEALKPAVKVVMKLKPLAGPISGILSVVTAQGKYEDVGKQTERLENCPAKVADPFLERIDNLLNMAAMIDAATAAAMISGALLGLATAGVGAAGVAVVSGAAIAAMKRDLKNRTKNLEQQIDSLDCSEKKRRRKDGSPIWIYDPSGYVYEGLPSNRLQGVTATLLQGPTASGPWSVWSAEPYLQVNPLVTDEVGRYAWDVPEGWWKVEYSKDGYELGYSDALPVLPPQLDVNEPLVALASPTLRSVVQDGGSLVLTFDRHMKAISLPPSSVTVTDGAGAAVPGALAAISPEVAPGSTEPLARAFRWTPTSALAAGLLAVTVPGGAQSYSGRSLGGDAVREVTATAVSAPPPDGGTGGTGGASPTSPTAPSPAPSPTIGQYRPLETAVRALDTRLAPEGRRTGGLTLQLPSSVGDDAPAVLLNVTVTDATASGHVVVHPAGSARPATSNVNFVRAETQANLVLTQVGAGRSVTVFVHGGPAHVIVDVIGSYRPASVGTVAQLRNRLMSLVGSDPAPADGIAAVGPQRLFDTRTGAARTGEVRVRLPESVPVEARAVLLNVTATAARTAAHVTAAASGSGLPDTSNVNVVPNRTQANLVLVEIGEERSVSLHAKGGPLHVIADLAGYQVGDAPAVPPTRVLDSRKALGTTTGTKLGRVALTLPSSVPADATAVLLNLTVTGSGGSGHVTVHAGGSSLPGTSNLNYRRGQTQANLVVTRIGPDRTVWLNVTGSATHLIADVMGVHPAA